MDSYKLRIIEGICLSLTVLISSITLSLPNTLINITGSATLLNIIYVTVITCILFFIIYKLFLKFPGCNIIDISEFLGGKVFKFIYGILFILYILALSALMFRHFSESISLIFFSHLNIDFILLCFIIAAGVLGFLGIKAISRLNIFALPLMLLSIIFLYFASLENYTVQRVFPILGYGLKETFIAGLSNISSFSGIYILLFVFPLLVNMSDYKKVGFTSISFYFIFLLLSVSALLFSFPQISDTSSPISLYLLARQISLGEYIQSIDALFLLIWIPFLLCFLAINIHFSLNTFKQITNIKYSSGMIYSFCAIIFAIGVLPKNMAEVNFLNNVFFRYVSIGFVFVLPFVILCLASIKKMIVTKRKKEVSDNA